MASISNSELFLLLDAQGGLIAFQETGAPWAGMLAFSSEELAREFVRKSGIKAAEIAAIATDDPGAVAAIVSAAKRLTIRNLLLDLDYKTGACTEIEFEGDGLGAARPRQFTPKP
ncbi:MAG: hypothetical protein ACREQI_09330 [Candidatus Binataceae bacterium]